MKKKLLISSLLLVSVLSVFSQAFNRQRPTGVLNTKNLASIRFATENKTEVKDKSTPTNNFALSKDAKTSTITWQKISASMNIFGSLISYCKPLQWNDELNAVSFIHRKSPTYSPLPVPATHAETGVMVAMVSLDCGIHWDSTALYANNNFLGHYPGGAIYNPSGNSSINNAYIVGAGPTTGTGSISRTGNWYASKKLGAANYNNSPSTSPNAQQAMPTAPPFSPNVPSRHDFAAYGFTATDDGKMRVLSPITDDATTSDTAVMLMTGTFNSSSLVIDWEGKVFDPPTTIASDGTENWTSRPIMAWNEQGTVGYVVIMGSRSGATGSNAGLQPIVYKTINSGSSWSLENGIDFNLPAYSSLKNKLWPISSDSNLVIPGFFWMEGYDAAVDFKNKLHIFTSLVGQYSNHQDSIHFVNEWSAEKYLWPHTEGQMPYLYDFVYDGTNNSPSWSYMLIDSLSTEGPGANVIDRGYQDNPWDFDTTTIHEKVKIDARLQLSRTPDGKYLLYSWSESDTAFTYGQKKWNNLPNIKARLIDLMYAQLTVSKLDVTSNAPSDLANHATCHFVSPKFKLRARSFSHISISVPMTVSNSTPYSQSGTNAHWYACADLEFSISAWDPWNPWDPYDSVGISEHNLISAKNIFVYPNPANNNTLVKINLINVAKVHIQLTNTLGQVIKTIVTEGTEGTNTVAVDLSGLATGIYFVNVKVDNATSTKKLIIE